MTLAELSVGPLVATAVRSSDAMIAATAISNELPLYTCNPADFDGIDGLEVVAVIVKDRP